MMIRTSLSPRRRDAGGVLVAVGDELEQAGRDARLDDADPHAVADRDQPVALGRQLDRVARVDLGQLARVGAGRSGTRSRSCRSPRRRSRPAPCCPAWPGRSSRRRRRAARAGGRCSARRSGSSGRARAPSGSARGPPPARPAPRAPWRGGSRPRHRGPSRGCLRFVSAASAHSAAVAAAMACSTSWRLRRTELAALAAGFSRSWNVTGGFVLSRRRVRAHSVSERGGRRGPRGATAPLQGAMVCSTIRPLRQRDGSPGPSSWWAHSHSRRLMPDAWTSRAVGWPT